ncbi:DUF4342 domain-containing protein [Alkalibaculum sporogenes]|uniref:DUF4342 domain-containing protein n=1 Tax=Alkalibaculum sporogenes TaxID=2655001 RepID=UPI00187B445E|nr:DUF4342 domain-containing protein [Alkalibaculum sporogenes]
MSTLTEIANKLIEETNCDTSQAIRALEQTGGDYDKALIIILKSQQSKSQDNQESQKQEEYKVNSKDLIDVIKQLIKEGNVSKITIKKDNETLVNIPVNAIAVTMVLAPFISIIAAVAAIATDCTVQVQRKGNVVVDVNESLKKTSNKLEKVINNLFNS